MLHCGHMGGPVLVLLGPDEAGCILLASFLPSSLFNIRLGICDPYNHILTPWCIQYLNKKRTTQ